MASERGNIPKGSKPSPVEPKPISSSRPDGLPASKPDYTTKGEDPGKISRHDQPIKETRKRPPSSE